MYTHTVCNSPSLPLFKKGRSTLKVPERYILFLFHGVVGGSWHHRLSSPPPPREIEVLIPPLWKGLGTHHPFSIKGDRGFTTPEVESPKTLLVHEKPSWEGKSRSRVGRVIHHLLPPPQCSSAGGGGRWLTPPGHKVQTIRQPQFSCMEIGSQKRKVEMGGRV